MMRVSYFAADGADEQHEELPSAQARKHFGLLVAVGMWKVRLESIDRKIVYGVFMRSGQERE